MGRFINADALVATGQGLSGNNMFAYCGNNSISRRDATGLFFETAIDLGFIGIDIYNLATDEGWTNWKNWVALGADLLLAVVPFATGGGQIVKAGDTINDLSKVTVVGETMSRVRKYAQSVNAIDNLYDGFQAYGKLCSKGKVGKVLAEIGGKLDNAAWLFGKLRSGYTVVDIGIDVTREARSSSYIMETVVMTFWKIKNVIKSAIKIWQGDE